MLNCVALQAVAPSGRCDRGRSYRQLRSLRSLAGGYECVALRVVSFRAVSLREVPFRDDMTPFGLKCRWLPPRTSSCHRCAVPTLISFFPWVTCALRTSPTAKFLSPPCGFVAPSGHCDRGRSYRQLRSLCSLAGGYDCVALRADDAAGVTPGGTSDAAGVTPPRHFRGRKRDASATPCDAPNNMHASLALSVKS